MPKPFVQQIITDVAQSIPSKTTDFSHHFQDLGAEGSILIYDSGNNQTYQHNAKRNETAFSPASTFKILNSLIALESGAISNEIAVLTWD
ncbi:MAG: class D beta-lactamase, partial [Symploca sp. SIO1A3]|nr:class D beta-lactamase [Symploca sp. SIO1A3]